MKITFFITTLGGGGAERVLCNLANFLNRRGHEISIIVLRGNDIKYPLDESICVKFLQKNYYLQSSSYCSRIKEAYLCLNSLYIQKQNDCLISFLELPVLYSLIYKLNSRQKLIICERNDPNSYSILYKYLYKMLSRKANACICQTREIENWYKPYLKNCKSYVIPNPLSDDFVHSSFSTRKSKTIISVGRLEPQKNHKMLIEAFYNFSKTHKEYVLKIYGDGSLRMELQKLIDKYRINNRVQLNGFNKNIREEMLNSSIFVLTSDFEGMPNVLLEALSLGLCCVSTDCKGGGARELINDGITGKLIPLNDSKSLTEVLDMLVTNDVISSRFASHAEEYRIKYSPSYINELWEKHISETINLK